MTSAHVGQALRRLLTTDTARAIWRPYVKRRGKRDPHHEAVAGAIAKHILGDGLRGREIKDRVRDALNGTRISSDTLTEVADTFSFASDVRDLLDELRMAQGRRAEQILETLSGSEIGTRPYRTVQLHEVHELGYDGWPRKHTTVQTIQSSIDALTAIDYAYVPGEDAASVDVTSGGTATSTRATEHPHHAGLITTTIKLSHVLAAGEPHDLTYVTSFSYSRQPEQAFRRGLGPQIEVVAIKVIFDGRRRPARIWETEWDGDDGLTVFTRRRVHLAAVEHSVQLLRRHPAARWIGYTWEWQ